MEFVHSASRPLSSSDSPTGAHFGPPRRQDGPAGLVSGHGSSMAKPISPFCDDASNEAGSSDAIRGPLFLVPPPHSSLRYGTLPMPVERGAHDEGHASHSGERHSLSAPPETDGAARLCSRSSSPSPLQQRLPAPPQPFPSTSASLRSLAETPHPRAPLPQGSLAAGTLRAASPQRPARGRSVPPASASASTTSRSQSLPSGLPSPAARATSLPTTPYPTTPPTSVQQQQQRHSHRHVFEPPPLASASANCSAGSKDQSPQRPPPRGHLVFDANFEGGNLQSVKRLDGGAEYEIQLRPDSLNPKHRLWFHFQISNCISNQQAVLTIVNFSKLKSLFSDGMTPVVRSCRRPVWHRIPARTCYYYRSPRHNNGIVLSFSLVFESQADTYELAYSFPFTYTSLQYELAYLDLLAHPYWRRQQLTRTAQQRRVDVITISCPLLPCPLEAKAAAAAAAAATASADADPAAVAAAAPGSSAAVVGGALTQAQEAQQRYLLGECDGIFGVAPSLLRGPGGASSGAARRRVVFITARVHPGETPASYVAQGLLQLLLADDAASAQLREALTWVVVPMLNPDGVFLGNYRTDAGGVDLNRTWFHTSPTSQPSLHHTLQLLQAYEQRPDCKVDLFIDLHAHSTSRSSFMFCNQPPAGDNTAAGIDRVTRLPRLLDACLPGFSLASCVFDSDPAKQGCARRVAATYLPSALCYTFEASMFHVSDMPQPVPAKGASTAQPNTIEGYMEMGRQLALGIGQLYGIWASGAASSSAAPQAPPTRSVSSGRAMLSSSRTSHRSPSGSQQPPTSANRHRHASASSLTGGGTGSHVHQPGGHAAALPVLHRTDHPCGM